MKWFEMLSKVISYPTSYSYLFNYVQLMGYVPQSKWNESVDLEQSKWHELEKKKSTSNNLVTFTGRFFPNSIG